MSDINRHKLQLLKKSKDKTIPMDRNIFELFRSKNPIDRRKMASNPNLPISMLKILINDEDSIVKELVANNPKYQISLKKAEESILVTKEERNDLLNIDFNDIVVHDYSKPTKILLFIVLILVVILFYVVGIF